MNATNTTIRIQFRAVKSLRFPITQYYSCHSGSLFLFSLFLSYRHPSRIFALITLRKLVMELSSFCPYRPLLPASTFFLTESLKTHCGYLFRKPAVSCGCIHLPLLSKDPLWLLFGSLPHIPWKLVTDTPET